MKNFLQASRWRPCPELDKRRFHSISFPDFFISWWEEWKAAWLNYWDRQRERGVGGLSGPWESQKLDVLTVKPNRFPNIFRGQESCRVWCRAFWLPSILYQHFIEQIFFFATQPFPLRRSLGRQRSQRLSWLWARSSCWSREKPKRDSRGHQCTST